MQQVRNPFPLFTDSRGALLDGGQIYVGQANADPEDSPVDLFWDDALTIPAQQPIRTLGGRVVNGAQEARLFTAVDDYSMRVRDADGVQIDYSPTNYVVGVEYQPLDTDLTAIAALATTPFGRGLLTLASAAALRTAAGITPFSGGTVTSGIVRSGAGVYPYWADSAMTGGRIYITAAGASDPTSQPGDIWFQTA